MELMVMMVPANEIGSRCNLGIEFLLREDKRK